MNALVCPVCSSAMKEATKNGVTIDTCTRCRGVWLDRGELEKLLAGLREEPSWHDDDEPKRHEYERQPQARPPYGPYAGHHPQGHYGHKKKSKLESFMDIFD